MQRGFFFALENDKRKTRQWDSRAEHKQTGIQATGMTSKG